MSKDTFEAIWKLHTQQDNSSGAFASALRALAEKLADWSDEHQRETKDASPDRELDNQVKNLLRHSFVGVGNNTVQTLQPHLKD